MTPAARPPRIHGYPTEGVLGIELCAAVPNEKAAVSHVESIGEAPRQWRVVGRVWRKDFGDDWRDVSPEEEGAVEFWEVLREDEIKARAEELRELGGT